jgi:hypothetical protein
MQAERVLELHIQGDQEIGGLLAKEDKMEEALVFDRVDPLLDADVLIGRLGRAMERIHVPAFFRTASKLVLTNMPPRSRVT